MSLKNADLAQKHFSRRRYTWPRSITARLTFLYALSSFAILLFAMVFLYRSLVSNLELEDRQFLSEKHHVLCTMLREHPADIASWKEEVQWESGELESARYFARILDARGRILIETPGMSEILQVRGFPAPTDGDATAISKRSGSQKRAFLTLSVHAEAAGPDGEDRTVQIALDVSNEVAFIDKYRRHLAMVLILGTVLAAGAGAAVARRGMAPLRRIAETVERITVSRLDERIESAHWAQELTTVANAFNNMLDGLEDSVARLSQFSADLAHELRTPLNNLMGEAEVALAKARTAEEYRAVIESATEEYTRLSSMMESLLFLARTEKPETQLPHTLLDARKEIEVVREYHAAQAADKGVTLTCKGEAQIQADSILFRRALSNLLLNALQHTPNGGHVDLSLRTADDQSVEIEVRDSGCGIAPQHLPHLFDRFYRVDHSRTDHPDGSGLGLAIVKAIMSLHHGHVSVRSDVGPGTSVTLRFPPSRLA